VIEVMALRRGELDRAAVDAEVPVSLADAVRDAAAEALSEALPTAAPVVLAARYHGLKVAAV
jgi:hypothetical protein